MCAPSTIAILLAVLAGRHDARPVSPPRSRRAWRPRAAGASPRGPSRLPRARRRRCPGSSSRRISDLEDLLRPPRRRSPRFPDHRPRRRGDRSARSRPGVDDGRRRRVPATTECARVVAGASTTPPRSRTWGVRVGGVVAVFSKRGGSQRGFAVERLVPRRAIAPATPGGGDASGCLGTRAASRMRVACSPPAAAAAAAVFAAVFCSPGATRRRRRSSRGCCCRSCAAASNPAPVPTQPPRRDALPTRAIARTTPSSDP